VQSLALTSDTFAFDVPSLPARSGKWLAHARPGAALPAFVEADFDALRAQLRDTLKPDASTLLFEYQKATESDLASYAGRKAVRDALADRIVADVLPIAGPDFAKLEEEADHLRACRLSGEHGIRTDTFKRVTRWDYKCGNTRLCPDDSRANAMKHIRRTKPVLLDEMRNSKALRLYYDVLTLPNVAAGDLHDALREIYRDWNAYRKRLARAGVDLVAAITSVEAPPSASGNAWNVHLNALMLVRVGSRWRETFSTMAACWPHMSHIQQIKKGAIESALVEVIKYSCKQTDLTTMAPAMFLEWWRAHRSFKRTRAYGVLHGCGEPEAERPEVVMLGRMTWRGFAAGPRYDVEVYAESASAENLILVSKSPGMSPTMVQELTECGAICPAGPPV